MKKTAQEKTTVITTAVFLTHTTLGMGIYHTGMEKSVFENGRRAFVLQGLMSMDLFGPCRSGGEEYVCEAIDYLFNELFNWSGTIDHLVVYVGAQGYESAIMFAAKFPHDKVTLVTCPCNTHEKAEVMARASFKKLHIVRSECGGWITMERLFHGFMDTGSPTLKRGTS
ncbi:hypothetical protein HYW94_03095 [Candidatus Uhrbacteria bacterium]|nr:hypothetical protein [Candidatus Uhrbacteria bacterium]